MITEVKIKVWRKTRKYPFQAKFITFCMRGQNPVDAVKTLMCYMGYMCYNYSFVYSRKIKKGVPA